MLRRTLPKTLRQIFYEMTFNSKVIVKSIFDPDNNLLRYLLSINGLRHDNWRSNVDKNNNNISPSDILWNGFWFQSYRQKYLWTRRQFLKELVNWTFSFFLQDITIPGYVRKAPGLAQPTSPRSPPLPGVGAVAGAAGVGGDEKGKLVRALSEEEARQLDQECHARFIKLSVKHITDGQVTCGKYNVCNFRIY